MSFQSLSAEVVGVLPDLSPFLADNFVNRALLSIFAERPNWSFLQADGAIVCPAQVTDGTASIGYLSASVTMDSDASTALLALDATSPLTTLQIRFGGTNNTAFAGQVYSITAVDQTDPTAIVLTLDRVVVQTTNATSGYQVYRCYVKPPVNDFLMWQAVVDMTNGWPLKLNYTSAQFDIKDPQRMSQGLGYFLGAFKGNPELQPKPQYEIWPHPTSGQTFYVRYRRAGEAFTQPTDTQPPLIPDALILHRVYGWHAYPWAAANVARYHRLRGVGWIAQTLDAKKMYLEQLQRTKNEDDNQELSSVLSRGHGLRDRGTWTRGAMPFPADAAFIQSHLLNF